MSVLSSLKGRLTKIEKQIGRNKGLKIFIGDKKKAKKASKKGFHVMSIKIRPPITEHEENSVNKNNDDYLPIKDEIED